MQPNAWAGLSSLTVDANGDAVFNGADDGDKLTITFTTDDFGEEDQEYKYEIKLDDGRVITMGPDVDNGQTLSNNQTVQYIWDGTLQESQNNRLPDGTYTIQVVLIPVEPSTELPGEILELTAIVTIDSTPPVIAINFEEAQFSPLLYSLPIYYDLNEDVTDAWLEVQKSPNDTTVGRAIELETTSGSHIYYWNGGDATHEVFSDGQYTLRIRAIDKSGNETVTNKTSVITIDTEEPRITEITFNGSTSITEGKFINDVIESISFTADDPGGTGVNLNSSDTEILIRPVGGNYITGVLSIGNNATLTISDPLDERAENGEYDVIVFVSDNVGNLAMKSIRFTFDNTVPVLKSVATNNGEFTPSSSLRGRTNFVEATLEDNTELNLTTSTIRVIDPNGSSVLGQQSSPDTNIIRWEFLSPLLADDGLQDGIYNIEIVGGDKAGNRTDPIQISFRFDNLAPDIEMLSSTRDGNPFTSIGNRIYHSLPLNQFVVTYNDGESGSGIAFSGVEEISSVFFAKSNPDGSITEISGDAFQDTRNGVLTYILSDPLLNTDGSQDGIYRLNVKAADTIGNIKTTSYQFIFDTQVPTLSSTVPAANATLDNLSEVVVNLTEVTSGIDFVQSLFLLSRVAGETQVEVPVNVTGNGKDQARLKLLEPMALDGSDDGTYVIEITPIDLAGNVGAVVRRQFYLVSQTQPQVRLTTPTMGTVNSLGDITVEIANYIGSGINYDLSTVVVRNPDGTNIQQSQVDSDPANNQLTWRTEATIPRNGTADGEYTITASIRDFSGEVFLGNFSVVLDTQFPSIDRVNALTDPQQQLSISSTTDINDTFSQINVEFDSSDVDFESTLVTLSAPDTTEIVLHRRHDGGSNLTLNFQNLVDLGTYTLTITSSDIAGNVSDPPYIFRFNLEIDVPVVSTVLIGGKTAPIVYVNGSNPEIIATFVDTTGTGLALGDGESSIVVLSESGITVPGLTTPKNDNQLAWQPIALPNDGSADGQYIVSVTPVDKAGRSGNVAIRSFIFDTQSPRISDAAPVTLHQPISYIGGSLSQFQFTVEDVGPAMLNLDSQTIGLKNKNDEPVAGQVTNDGTNQLFFTLTSALPTDGTADGEYILTVDLEDKAGNSYQSEHKILYDSQTPQLTSVSLNTDVPLDLTPYQVTNLTESINQLALNFSELSQIDFANTQITLMGPEGAAVPLTLENNGRDQIVVRFVTLSQGGLYTLSITPQDIVGNVIQGAIPYPFRLMIEVPELSSVIANSVDDSFELTSYQITDISNSIGSLTVSFSDGARVDFENTNIILIGPDGQEISVTQEEIEDSQLFVLFVPLTQSGLYALIVTPHDTIGNVAQRSIRYQFRLDIALPKVSSVLIGGRLGTNVYVNSADTNIVVTFTDTSGVGLALGDGGSEISVNSEDGSVVSGITTSSGTNQLTWTPSVLPTDGSADGRYTVTITPIDKVGRTGAVVNRHFIYDTQEPRISAATPVTLHQPISYVGGSLTQFVFTVEDVGPALLDLDMQSISLEKESGDVVAGTITDDDTNQLFYTLSTPLPTDGSSDGSYILNVNLIDKAGNRKHVQHNIIYDSQTPQIVSVTLNTDSSLNLTPYEVTELSETINKLTVSFDELTRVDFANTVVTLTSPDDVAIPLTLQNNGTDVLSASFVSLAQSGMYLLSVTPQDIIGNVVQGAVQYPFRLKFATPNIESVKANGQDTSFDLSAYQTTEISDTINSLTVSFTDAMRVDYENTQVTLQGIDGQEIPVTLEGETGSDLVVRFVSLTQSGEYSLSVRVQDTSGIVAKGAIQYPFRLKFATPNIESVKANGQDASFDLSAYQTTEISDAINSLSVSFTDAMRVDYENMQVTLQGIDGQEIPVTLEGETGSDLVVRFVSLTQSGEYTLLVRVQDTSGNVAQGAVQYPFRLKFATPNIESVKANSQDTSFDLSAYQTTEISDTINSLTVSFTDAMRVDYENTQITLRGIDGQEIPVTLEGETGSDLVVRFVSLTQSGEYSLSVRVQDTSGNVAQGAVQYPFRLKFATPNLESVKANGQDTSFDLSAYQTTEISDAINSLSVSFTDAMRVDYENTQVTLRGIDGQEIPVTLEGEAGSDLVVRFISLSQSGEYTLSVRVQDTSGNVAQGAVQYPFRLKFTTPNLESVKANGQDTSFNLSAYQTTEISDTINSLTVSFMDAMRVDYENTQVTLRGIDGQEIPVTLEGETGSDLVVRFVSLTQSGEYTLSVRVQDTSGNVAQGAVQYPFRLKFATPNLESVKANGQDTSFDLSAYQTTEISDTINSLTVSFTDAMRVDYENTQVTLRGIDGQEIPVTLEGETGSDLVVRFVSLTQSGEYTLSVRVQDTSGNVAQGAVQYPFRLKFATPNLESVKANGQDTSFDLSAYQTTEISDAINSLTVSFTDAMRVDYENTQVTLQGIDGQEIPVTLEGEAGSDLVVRFISLSQNGEYTLSVRVQDTSGNIAQGAVQYPFRLKFATPNIKSVKAISQDTSFDLSAYQTTEISDAINSLSVSFTDAMRVDYENTQVTLRGIDGQEIPVTLEGETGSDLVVRFVSLTQSGEYTLSVRVQDTSGNIAQGAVQYPFRLKFATPNLESVKANGQDTSFDLSAYQTTEISDAINSLSVSFTDAMRVDYENTQVTLRGIDGQEIPVTLEGETGSDLVVRFVSLTQSGEYTLSVRVQDTSGNIAQGAVQYPFRLKFATPNLESVKANGQDTSFDLSAYQTTEISDAINSLTVSFTDAMRVDYENTLVTLRGIDGQEIPVTLEGETGSDLVVRFVSLTQSGEYTLSVRVQDTSGNVAQGAVQYPFRLKFATPNLESVKANGQDTSFDLSAYQTTEISDAINSLSVSFTDAMRVDYENTQVTLRGIDGQEIPVTLEGETGSDLVVRFVSLTQSGEYTLSVRVQDTSGNVAQGAVQYPFRLKFVVPGIASVKANTADSSMNLIQHQITELSESINSLTLEFTDAMQVDFDNTVVTLTGPNEENIGLTLEENDDLLLIVHFIPLTQNGNYTLSVTPQDKAGNVTTQSIQYQFKLDMTLPSVSSVVIDGKFGSTVYVRSSIPRIVATITDPIGVGVTFGDGGSSIVVRNSGGDQIDGTITSNGTDQLIWTPIPLLTDGTADGIYTVAITPMDKAGRSGTVVTRQFIFDTQAPRITSASPVTLHAPTSYIGGGLTQFVLTIEDAGPAGLIYSSQVVALLDGNEKPVPAALTHDELTNQLYLTLNKPFASDGSEDGPYTLHVLLIDKAGNQLTSQFTLVYDSIVPIISSVEVNTAGNPTALSQNEVADLSESVDTITIKFDEATRVNFANTTVSLLDPDDLTVPLSVGNDGVSQMTLRFVELTKIGQYTLSVTPQDIAGNVRRSPNQYAFNLEFILPDVESVVIGDTITLGSGDIAYVNAENIVIVANLLDPADTGLSFDSLTGSDILVATLDGIIVPGSIATNGKDVLAWSPLTLSSDGSSDGRYAVYVTPVDKQGREGSTIYREFIYDTQTPEITSASPINLSQPVSYISASLTQLQFTLQDVGPADLTLADQVVRLRNQSGGIIPTKLTNDTNNQLYLTLDQPLPLDGSQDGNYTVEIELSDKAGNVLTLNHPIVYDTQAPTVVSTVPEDGALLTEDITQFQVNLNDEGGSGIDWDVTSAILVDPNGVEISGELSSNGTTQLTLRTNQLVADGRYIIRVQAVDRAGNGSSSVFDRSFLLSRRLPAVISTSPITAPQDEAYTNEEIEEIRVLLETADERHLSTVRLLNALGQVIAGQQNRQEDGLVYTLVRPLATDGSEDGIYTIEFTPISSSGRSGEVQQLTFTYDTQIPEIETDAINLIVSEPEVNNSLVEIRVVITDNEAGIDWENLDEDWLSFEMQSPNVTDIEGQLSYESGEVETLVFRLTVPLADDGSADGEYKITVTPTDKAGNGEETYEKVFTYDTSAPIIDPNSLLINDVPLLIDIDLEDYPSAISTSGGVVIQASVTDTGLGVNLSQSRIVITNPNGQEVTGTTQQNGIDTIVFKSDGLNIEGMYGVQITGIGNDSELLGFAPKGSMTTTFLYETTSPTAIVTNDGGKNEFTDEAIPFEGTASDPEGVRRAGGAQGGDGEIPIPASGVKFVEIVGTGPDGQPIEPMLATDESNAQQPAWSMWSVDFLPTSSGEYDLDIRVTDNAGNSSEYDIGEYTMSVSFSFKGKTFGWPNPLRHSKNDVAYISFDLNTATDETVEVTLYIYDWGGDLVYSKTHANVTVGERNDAEIKWNLDNQAGTPVARGIYVFRLEATNATGNSANAVGKLLVVD